jgi:hypothetical protein
MTKIGLSDKAPLFSPAGANAMKLFLIILLALIVAPVAFVLFWTGAISMYAAPDFVIPIAVCALIVLALVIELARRGAVNDRDARQIWRP